MTQRGSTDIKPDQISAYQDRGIVYVPEAFSPDEVDFLRDITERDMATPSPMGLEATRDGTGRFFGDTFVWQHMKELEDFIQNSQAADLARHVMQTKKVNLLFDQLLVKEPGTSTPTIWHHDQTYWPVAGHHVCTMWIALDPVTKDSGAVEYVKGSHLWGQRYKAQSFKDKDLYKEDLPDVPDIDSMRDELEFDQFEMQPGDCTIHHGLTLHGASGNLRTDVRRRAYIMRWTGDDATYNPRPNLQPMLYDPPIKSGDPLDCDLFPVVRQ